MYVETQHSLKCRKMEWGPAVALARILMSATAAQRTDTHILVWL